MYLNIIGDADLPKYNELVDSSEDGTIFHKTWWHDIIKSNNNNYYIKYYGIYEKDNLIAAMPIPTFIKLKFKFIYNPKFTPYLGPIFINNRDSNCKKITNYTREKRMKELFAHEMVNDGLCMYYSFNSNNNDFQPFKWNNFDLGVHYSYRLKLKNFTNIYYNMAKNRRNDIEKRNKEFHKIVFGNIDDLILLSNKTMKRQSRRPLDASLLKTIYYICNDNNKGEVITLYDECNCPKASILLVWDSKRSYYLAGGMDNDTRGDMSLLIWKSIEYLHDNLYIPEFDFEGSDIKV